jgi:hypothetical protein
MSGSETRRRPRRNECHDKHDRHQRPREHLPTHQKATAAENPTSYVRLYEQDDVWRRSLVQEAVKHGS